MIEEYITDIDADEGNLLIFDKTGYKLSINIPDNITRENVYDIWFNLPCGIPVTHREVDTYSSELSEIKIKATDKCLEVGSGLAEWIPYILEKIEFDERPTVIELSDYKKMKNMLQYAINLRIDPKITPELESLVRRCDVYLDPEKVNLINFPFIDAIQNNPELVGKFDVVVDIMGADLYQNMSSYGFYVSGIEKRLLAPDGILISQDPHKTFRNIGNN